MASTDALSAVTGKSGRRLHEARRAPFGYSIRSFWQVFVHHSVTEEVSVIGLFQQGQIIPGITNRPGGDTTERLFRH